LFLKFNQIAVLRILNSFEDVIINENRNGIHINLSELSEEVINKLQEYTNYVITQETTLNQDEKQKEDIKNIYFS
jgi:predicted  nucleic acid-binding Zn-ribbon protein